MRSQAEVAYASSCPSPGPCLPQATAGPCSPSARYRPASISTWTTDFRDDLPKTDVPMLVIQGDDDQVLPYLRRANGGPA